jgi:hypothetical protein
VLGSETREFLEQSGVPMVPKPFVLEEVRRVIRELTARG